MDMLETFKQDPDARQAAYSKLGRRIAKSTVPAKVMTRYNLEKADEKTKFIFLCEFMTDPSFASMTIQDKQQNKKS